MDSIVNYITDRWKSVNIKKTGKDVVVDSQLLSAANYFYIDEKSYDKVKGLKKIKEISISDLILINFSLFTMMEGYGSRIIVFTKKGHSKSLKKFLYNSASTTAFRIKKSPAIDSVYGSGNCALILNDHLIEPSKAASTFFSIKFESILYIGYTTGYQIPVYGEDSKNGVVFIWTKEKK
jgi:hypothetical protein